MKVLDVALKDLSHSFRSAFALVFMFVVPLLTVGLFYFAFGSLGSDGDGFDLPRTKLRVVNLDAPDPQYGGFSAGQMLAEFLASEELAHVVEVAEAADAASARAAVDRQEAGVAVIIPAGFTNAVFDPEGRATVELYQDPTLTIGPGIVKDVVTQFVDGFAGTKIAAGVASGQLTEQGLAMDVGMAQGVAVQYADWSETLGESQQAGVDALLDIQSPGSDEGQATVPMVRQILTLTMTGMMIFYAFFTGANSSQTILKEEEDGTLSRLFTTPTSRSTILGGKFLATFLTIFVQVVVLVVVASLVFGVEWGALFPLALATLGLVALAASFGIFIISLLKNTRQTGIIIGGVITVTGMAGVSSMFTANVPGASEATNTANIVSLFLPQGWAMRAWRLVLDSSSLGAVLWTVAVMLILSAGFFLIGVVRFRKRFA